MKQIADLTDLELARAILEQSAIKAQAETNLVALTNEMIRRENADKKLLQEKKENAS